VRTGVFVSGTLAMFAFGGNRDSIRSADPKYCHPQMGGWKDVTMKRFAGRLRESGIHKSLDITIDFPERVHHLDAQFRVARQALLKQKRIPHGAAEF